MTTTELLSFSLLVIFAMMLNASIVLILFRLIWFRRMKLTVPVLLWRDLAVKVGFGISIGAVLVLRFLRQLGISEDPIYQVWWILITTLPAVLGMGVFLYFELVIIGPPATPGEAYRDREES